MKEFASILVFFSPWWHLHIGVVLARLITPHTLNSFFVHAYSEHYTNF
jgi:hypothetical protein